MECVLIHQRPFVWINHSAELSVWRIKRSQLYSLESIRNAIIVLPGELGDRLDRWSAVLITVTVESFPELSNDDARVDMDVETDDAPSLPTTTSGIK